MISFGEITGIVIMSGCGIAVLFAIRKLVNDLKKEKLKKNL
jgi:hypothetical protein